MLTQALLPALDTTDALGTLSKIRGTFGAVHEPVVRPAMLWWQTLILCRSGGKVTTWLAGRNALSAFGNPELWESTRDWATWFLQLPAGTRWGIEGGGVIVMDMDRSTIMVLQDDVFPGIIFREAKRMRLSRGWRNLVRQSAGTLTRALMQAMAPCPGAQFRVPDPPITTSRGVVYCPEGWSLISGWGRLTADEALFAFLLEMRSRGFGRPDWSTVQQHLDSIKEEMEQMVASSRQTQLERLVRDWTSA